MADLVHYWKSDFSADQIREFARKGIAMPDGSYPIPDREYLEKAIKAVGRGRANSHNTIRTHIQARAKALGLSNLIPDGWGTDGSIQKGEIDLDLAVPLWKDDAQQLVYGVVLQPGVEDSQGDLVAADEIQKAAHRFLTDYRKHDVQHSEDPAAVETVESFIAPQDMDIAGEPVLKGSWVMCTHVKDADVWGQIQKGELTGYSIGGSGVREPVTKADDPAPEPVHKTAQLRNLDVEFVSLVDRAAVRDPSNTTEPMRFLLFKREGDPDPQGGSMTEAEARAAVEKAEQERDELTKQLEQMTGERDELTKRVDALEKAAKNPTSDDNDDDSDDMNKADLSPAVRAQLEKRDAEIAELRKQSEEDAKIAKEERDLRLTREFIAKAESYKALPLKPADFGPVLKSAAEKLTKEQYEALEGVLKAADEQIAAGELFKEHGRGGVPAREDSAIAEATRKAEELRKSDSNLRADQALDRVFESDRDLQTRYLAEMRG